MNEIVLCALSALFKTVVVDCFPHGGNASTFYNVINQLLLGGKVCLIEGDKTSLVSFHW
jgi:hypothetical protein